MTQLRSTPEPTIPPTTSQPSTSPVAYSYIRFSSPKQAEGDSLRRQSEKAAAWCQRKGVRLDTSLTLHDLGTSAFTGKHRENPDQNALAQFLKLVEQGRVPRGSYLIVESLDRLTREHIRPALMLMLGLMDRGIRIVQLTPVEMVFDDKVDMTQLMMALVELSRGNSESQVKSERCRAAWSRKKEAARAGEVMTTNLPAWLESRNSKIHPIPARVEIVRRIFSLAANGYGLVSIAKKLKAEGIPSFGRRKDVWTRSYLALILKDRRVIGEHQPMREGKPDGSTIPNYYPAVVSEQQWLAAGAGRKQRTSKRGRVSRHINLFAGLLKSAADGSSYYLDTQRSGYKLSKLLRNMRATEGLGECRSIPYETFEAAILSQLREVDPTGLTAGGEEPNRLAVYEGELAQLEEELAAIEAEVETGGPLKTLARVAEKKEKRREEVFELIEQERQRLAVPSAGSWQEMHSLTDLLANAPDPTDLRMRLQSALRRVVSRMLMIVVPRGPIRSAYVQVHFHAGGYRYYQIFHQPALAPGGKLIRMARWITLSLPHPNNIISSGRYDLGDADELAFAESDLRHYPLDMVEKLMRDKYGPVPGQTDTQTAQKC